MPQYVTTDRATLYGLITARLADYARRAANAAVGAGACADEQTLDLWLGLGQLQHLESPAAGSQAERRAALLIGYLVERHALGGLPLPIAPLPTVTVSGLGGGGPVTWSSILGIPGNLVYGPLTSASITNFNAAVQALIDAGGAGVTSHPALTDVEVLIKPGEVSPTGQKHLSAQVGADLLALLYPFVAPTASLSLSPSGVQELGTTLGALTVDGGFAQNSDSAPTLGVYKRDGSTIASQTSGIGAAITLNNISASTTLQFLVTFPASGVKTASATLSFVAPSFEFTPVSDAPSEATVEAGTKRLWTRAARTLHLNCAGARPGFAEPQSNGIRTVIRDKNGFDITADMVRVSATYTLADGVTTAPYYRYVHANLQTDPDFILNLE